MSGKIITERDFLVALYKAHHRYEWEFALYESGMRIPSRKKAGGWVHGYSIYHSEGGMHWSPFMVVYSVFCCGVDAAVKQDQAAAESMGLPVNVYKDISAAAHEAQGHSRPLRKKLLLATGLKEVPHRLRLRRSPV